ncbi:MULTISPECIES: DUF3219 family protein [unclassified Oceanobacillus]|uniref:DUF3219 family protein n=1 Tax=unclassified Oceanobacillus TaxID=2630292 RepID=UPI0012EC0D1D|nr:DUF3219 family protein [Oceanobacillus sp. AG]
MEVVLNELKLDAQNVKEEIREDKGKVRKFIAFDFKVHSDDYHDVTTELYKNDFLVRVPERNLEFQAVIHNYSTSVTDLYVQDAVGDFKLELIEK